MTRNSFNTLEYKEFEFLYWILEDSTNGRYADYFLCFRHGQKWYEFRTKVQQPMLQPRTAKFYIGTIEDTATAFVNR